MQTGALSSPDWPAEIHAYGFPAWKHKYVRRCLAGRRVHFIKRGGKAPRTGALLLWGMFFEPPPGTPADMKVLRMEDGFLRSVGLGAELTRPLSWVIDGRGIHYDCSRASDLETLLAGTVFSPELLARAQALRGRITALGLTKYSLPGRAWQRPPGDRPLVLVAGQVESDASLAYGAPGLRTNMELLRAVRAARPQAYIVYKPHPDVVARLRAAGKDETAAAQWCDEILPEADMAPVLEQVDEVHVLTSLAGFEALLRGKRVVCHGLPFYAGWGLTEDSLPAPRRGRALSLDALVAGALILYPRYFGAEGLVTPEAAIAELADWKQREAARKRPFQGLRRFVLRLVIGVR